MGFDLFPRNMGNYRDSKQTVHLKHIRICLSFLSFLHFLKISLFTPAFYITLQGLTGFLSLIFFLETSLSYYIDFLKQNNPMCVFFLICWALSWSNVIINQLYQEFDIDPWTWALPLMFTVD
jgi:hypothetical protein